MKLKSLSYCASLNKYFLRVSLQLWFMLSYIWFVNVDLVDRYIIDGCIRLRGNYVFYVYIRGFFFFLSIYCLNEVIQEIIMFSHCRSLGRYKSLVRNRAAPEGSIVKGYLADEILTFCSWYLENALTVHNRPQRNPDEARGTITRVTLDRRTLMQIYRYIIFNSDEFRTLRAWVLFFNSSCFGSNIHFFILNVDCKHIGRTWLSWGTTPIEADYWKENCTDNIGTHFVFGTVTT